MKPLCFEIPKSHAKGKKPIKEKKSFRPTPKKLPRTKIAATQLAVGLKRRNKEERWSVRCVWAVGRLLMINGLSCYSRAILWLRGESGVCEVLKTQFWPNFVKLFLDEKLLKTITLTILPNGFGRCCTNSHPCHIATHILDVVRVAPAWTVAAVTQREVTLTGLCKRCP